MSESSPPRSYRQKGDHREIHVRLPEDLAREIDDMCNERLISRAKFFDHASRILLERWKDKGNHR